jgi:hypothetical protein
MPKHDFLSPRRTGRADFPHPAFTQTLAARQYVSLNANLAGRPKPRLSGSACAPAGAKEKVSTRELSPVLPPLPGLDQRLGLVSQGLRRCEKILKGANSPPVSH